VEAAKYEGLLRIQMLNSKGKQTQSLIRPNLVICINRDAIQVKAAKPEILITVQTLVAGGGKKAFPCLSPI
jgi:hypothetical protein